MQIDITNLARDIAPRDYSASVVELGNDAGKITWGHACDDALELFGDQFDREAFDTFFRYWGAWSDAELAAHSDREAAALMLQFIAGDMREADFSNYSDIEKGPEPFTVDWWPMYEAAAKAGQVSSRFWRDASGSIFYDIEN